MPLVFDDFDQNLEGADQGQPGPLLLETADLVKALLHYLPFSGKMTQLIITSRYRFSLTENGRDLIKERLGPVCLTSFQESEQRKKARELKNILNYADQSVVPQLRAAGCGNPRLMEWLDVLVGQMAAAEVPQLLDAIRDKQERFIRKHVIQELLHSGGDELACFLRWFSIFRRPVLLEGTQEIGEKAGLEEWKELLHQGLGLSLVEHDQARQSYQVTPLLREELLKDLEEHQFLSCHEAAFTYYKKKCESQDRFDPLVVEEWIFHALGYGEEDTASEQGGRLVEYLRECLAFQESKGAGEWVLVKKIRELSTEYDAFLLSQLAFTIDALGDYYKAIDYYEKALIILKEIYGEKHTSVATVLNNLGEERRTLGEPSKAIDYYEQALTIWKKFYGETHTNVATVLNNLGEARRALGEPGKAIDCYEQALTIWKKFYGETHPQVATGMNNMGLALYALGDYIKAIDYYEQALTILKEVYVEKHPNVARTLNNLGKAYFDLGQKEKAKGYMEKAYTMFKKLFGEEHPDTKNAAMGLEACTKS
ncbi:tetratricopeptide repeat protein [Acidobacteriota bacterium]